MKVPEWQWQEGYKPKALDELYPHHDILHGPQSNILSFPLQQYIMSALLLKFSLLVTVLLTSETPQPMTITAAAAQG